MPERSLVRNAADPRQVGRAGRVGGDLAATKRAAWLAVLTTPAGRYVMWDLICRAGVFAPLWKSSAEIHATTAKHDFGLELLRELQAVDLPLVQLMQREAWDRDARANQATDAAHAAIQEVTSDDDSSSGREG